MITNETYNLSRGLGFTINDTSLDVSIPPEAFIVGVIAETGNDLILKKGRMHSLLRTWVRNNARFLRTDLLESLSLSLDDNKLRLLGSFLCIARDNNSSSRWKRLIARVQPRITQESISLVDIEYPEEGLDSYLLEFGIRYRNISFQDDRKFMDLEWIIENNPWIRNRFLMTVSGRADMFTYSTLNNKIDEINVCRDLSISRSSFYSIRGDLEILRKVSA